MTARIILFSIFSLSVLPACSDHDELEPELQESPDLQEVRGLPVVHDGRLVFEDGAQFDRFLNDESAMEQLSLELADEGFVPLKEVATGDELGYADFILNLYNHDGEIEIGDEFVLIDDWVQYIVRGGDEALLDRVRDDLAQGVEVEHDGVIVFENTAQMLPTLETEGEGESQAAWLDASYQHEFFHGPTKMKYIYEAYTVHWYSYLKVRITPYVRSKMEWLHGNTWKAAGEIVYKEIKNLNFSVLPLSSGAPVGSMLPWRAQQSNVDHTISGPTTADVQAPQWFHVTISGEFYSEWRHPGIAEKHPYSQNCSWDVLLYY